MPSYIGFSKYYFKYWGKALRQEGQLSADYHLLPYHCLDVAAVGQSILRANHGLMHDLAEFLELTEEQLSNVFCFMLGLHDLGKFSSSFQKLYSHSFDALYSPDGFENYDGKNFRHDRLGLHFWRLFRNDILLYLIGSSEVERREQERMFDALAILADCVLGHHGQPINKKDPNAIKAYVEEHNEQAVKEPLKISAYY